MLMRKIVLAVVLSGPTGAVLASGLPDHYPESFQFEGTIAAIDSKTSSILANDYVLRCAPDVMVHTPKGSKERIGSLRSGQRIGVYFEDPTARRRLVKDIWILPAD